MDESRIRELGEKIANGTLTDAELNELIAHFDRTFNAAPKNIQDPIEAFVTADMLRELRSLRAKPDPPTKPDPVLEQLEEAANNLERSARDPSEQIRKRMDEIARKWLKK